MKKSVLKAVTAAILLSAAVVGCNNGLNSHGNSDGAEKKKMDRSQRTVIDSAEYIDFTSPKYNALTYKKEDVLFTLGGKTFKNGNSYIKFNRSEGTLEINSDRGWYNGKGNCQIYGKFGFEIMAASSDCLYIRRNPRMSGTLLIDNVTFKDDQIPDLAVCLPLYGFSQNRIEVSSVMNGYIVMPGGTYWIR
ncbi:MAG: hypothetical protein LBU85_09800 [Treponema sp.]|jgi:hypothetical protein|nr:hypothetical protein [Treponema sp.]